MLNKLVQIKSDILKLDSRLTEGEFFGHRLLAAPDLKVAFNFCELSNNFQQTADKNQLAELHQTFEENGWKVISVFEDEAINNTEIILSRCKNALGLIQHKVYARKCRIVEVSTKDSRSFLKANHIQGAGGGSYGLGLEYEGELVTIATFSKARFNPIADYELIRFASKLNTVVVGGASKLFAAARERLGVDKHIISYADKRYGSGGVYDKCGLIKINLSAPCYWYYRSEDPSKKYHRSAFQKHKLSGLLKNFDISKTELRNMEINGWSRIFDAGCAVYSTVKY